MRAILRFAALVAMSSSCTRQPAPPPGAERAPPPTAPVTEQARTLEAVAPPDPASALACDSTGRVAFDADSVALRFTAAFLKVGILPIRLSLPSTGGVNAGPVDVTVPVAARISARAMTEARNDGTAFRVNVRVGPTEQAWTHGDSVSATAHAGALCDRVVSLAFPL